MTSEEEEEASGRWTASDEEREATHQLSTSMTGASSSSTT
jgi:hypothetical protein